MPARIDVDALPGPSRAAERRPPSAREARRSRQAEHAGGARLRIEHADAGDEIRAVREIEIVNARARCTPRRGRNARRRNLETARSRRRRRRARARRAAQRRPRRGRTPPLRGARAAGARERSSSARAASAPRRSASSEARPRATRRFGRRRRRSRRQQGRVARSSIAVRAALVAAHQSTHGKPPKNALSAVNRSPSQCHAVWPTMTAITMPPTRAST